MPTQAARFYRLLLKVYPARHQREYAELMVQVFGDLYRQTTHKRPTLWDWLAFWTHIVSDTAVAATIEHYHLLKDAAMKNRLGLTLLFASASILLYLLFTTPNIDFTAVYFCVLIAGGLAWMVNRFGLIKFAPFWQTYTYGALLGCAAVIILILNSMSAFTLVQNGSGWTVLTLSMGIYTIVLLAIGHLFRNLGKLFWMNTAIIPLIATVALWLSFRTMDSEIMAYFPVSLSFSLVQILVIIIISVLCIQYTRQNGSFGAIAMMASAGMIYAAFYPFDRSQAGLIPDLMLTLFPLVVCPMCWLIIKTPNSRFMWTFGLWSFMILIIELTPILGIGGQTFNLRLRSDLGTSHLVTIALPLMVMMWVVLRHASNATTKEDKSAYSTSTSPTTAHAAKR